MLAAAGEMGLEEWSVRLLLTCVPPLSRQSKEQNKLRLAKLANPLLHVYVISCSWFSPKQSRSFRSLHVSSIMTSAAMTSLEEGSDDVRVCSYDAS